MRNVRAHTLHTGSMSSTHGNNQDSGKDDKEGVLETWGLVLTILALVLLSAIIAGVFLKRKVRMGKAQPELELERPRSASKSHVSTMQLVKAALSTKGGPVSASASGNNNNKHRNHSAKTMMGPGFEVEHEAARENIPPIVSTDQQKQQQAEQGEADESCEKSIEGMYYGEQQQQQQNLESTLTDGYTTTGSKNDLTRTTSNQ